MDITTRQTPYSFLELQQELERRKKLSPEGYSQFDVPTFTNYMQSMGDVPNAQMYQAGARDPFYVKSISSGVQGVINRTGTPYAAGEIAGGLSKMISPRLEETGREFGRGLPRMVGELGVMATGLPGMIAGIGSMGADTFTQTDSPVAAGVTMASMGLMSKSGTVGRDLASKALLKWMPGAANAEGVGLVGTRAAEEVGRFTGFASNQKLANLASSFATRQPGQDWFGENFTPEALYGDALSNLLMFADPRTVRDIKAGPKAEGMNFDSWTAMLDAQNKMRNMKESVIQRTKDTMDQNDKMNLVPEIKPLPDVITATVPTTTEPVFGDRGVVGSDPFQTRTTLSPQAEAFVTQDLNKNALVSQTINQEAWRLAKEHGMNVTPETTLGDVQSHLKGLGSVGNDTLLGSSAPDTHLPQHIPVADETGTVQASLVKNTDIPNQPVRSPIDLLKEVSGIEPTNINEADRLFRQFSSASKQILDHLSESYDPTEIRKTLGIDPSSNLPLNDSVLRRWFQEFHKNTLTETPDEVLDRVVNRVKSESQVLVDALNKERIKRLHEQDLLVEQDKSSADKRQEKYVEKLKDLPSDYLDHYAKTIREASKDVADSHQMSRIVTNAAMRYFGAAEHYVREGGTPQEPLIDFQRWASNMGAAVAREKERQRSKESQKFVQLSDLEEVQRKASQVKSEERDPLADFQEDPSEVDFMQAVQKAPDQTKKYWFNRITDALKDPKFWSAVRDIKGSASAFNWPKYQERLKAYVDFLQTSGTDVQGSEAARGRFTDLFKNKEGVSARYYDTARERGEMFLVLNKALRDSGLLGEYEHIYSTDDVKPGDASPSIAGPSENVLKSMGESVEGVLRGGTKPSKGYTFAAVRRMFSNALGRMGYSEPFVKLYTEMALRVSQTFRGMSDVHVTELLSSEMKSQPGASLMGVHLPEGTILTNGTKMDKATIGLFMRETAKPKALDAFLKLKTLGHELSHVFKNIVIDGTKVDVQGADAKRLNNYKALLDKLTNMGTEERATLVQGLMELTVPSKYYLDPKTGQVDKFWEGMVKGAASTPEETLSEVSGLVSTGIAASSMNRGVVEKMQNLMLFGDKHLSDFSQGYFRDIANMGDVVTKYFEGIETVKGVDSGNRTVTDEVKGILEDVKKLARRPKDLDRAVRTLSTIVENADPGVFMNKMFANPVSGGIIVDDMRTVHTSGPINPSIAGAINAVGEAMGMGKKKEYMKLQREDPSFFQVWHPWQQIGERYPVLKPLVGILTDWRSVRARFAVQNMAPLLTRTKGGRMVVDTESSVAMVAKDKAMTKAVGDILRFQNQEERVLSDEEMRNFVTVKNLTPDKVDNVVNATKSLLEVYKNFANSMVKGQQDDIENIIGSMVMNFNKSLTPQSAKTLGGQLFQLDLLQRQGMPVAQDQMRQLLGQFKPEQAVELAEYAREVGNSFVKFSDYMASRTWFSSERRVGEYLVEYQKYGQRVVRGAKNEAEIDSIRKQVENDPTVKGFQVTTKLDRMGEFNGLDSKTIQSFLNFEREVYDSTLKRIGQAEADKLKQLYQPGALYIQEIKKRQLQGALAKRRLVAGREDLNLIESAFDYFTGVSYGLARKYTRGQAMLALKDPSLADRPDLQSLAYEKVDRSFNQQSKEWDLVNKGTAMYYMASNLSSAMLEGTQVLQQLMPHLTRYGAGIGEGYKLLGSAAKELMSANLSGKSGPLEFKDKTLDWAYKKALDEQVVSYGFMDDLNWHDDLDALHIKRVTDGKYGEMDRADLVKNVARYAVKLSMWPKTRMNELNSSMGFLTSFKFKLSRGATPEEAYDFAKNSVIVTNFSGGKIMRPLVLDKLGEHTGAAGFISTLQGYTMNAIASFYRRGLESVGKTGLQGQELHNARAAFGQAFFTLFATAGALGLPGVAASMSAVENLTGMQVNAAVRQGLTSLGGDDEELGGLIRDTALHGVMYRTGLDVSGRVGLSNILGIDPNTGFSPESMFGAGGNIVHNMVTGVKDLSQGQFGQAAQDFAPQALKPMIDLYRNDGKFFDRKGNLLFEPSTAQQLMYAIGFRPTELSELRAAQSMMRKADDIATQKQANWYKELADMLIQGHGDRVRQALLDKEIEDQNFDAKAGLSQVVLYAQKKLLPVDLLDSAPRSNLQGKSDIAKTFSMQPRVSQTQKIQLAAQLAAEVGIPGAAQITSRKMTRSTMIDQLVRQYPTMTVTQAAEIVEKAGF